jgi:hypothetical protein
MSLGLSALVDVAAAAISFVADPALMIVLMVGTTFMIRRILIPRGSLAAGVPTVMTVNVLGSSACTLAAMEGTATQIQVSAQATTVILLAAVEATVALTVTALGATVLRLAAEALAVVAQASASGSIVFPLAVLEADAVRIIPVRAQTVGL